LSLLSDRRNVPPPVQGSEKSLTIFFSIHS
jgi:hypothetical protein